PSNLDVAPAHGVSSLNAQQAVAEGEQLSWLSEKRLTLQSLECLQRTVARLEDEKVELKQQNAELRRTLEQVEHERRRLKRCFRGQILPGACGLSHSQSDQHKVSASRQEESHAHCSQRLAELQNQVSRKPLLKSCCGSTDGPSFAGWFWLAVRK
ncbi:centrosome-associated protein CEP250-like, partial [Empidonax traillii]|uniref:centrosome-associated protein CEP250-like n=1 Tax=Empidonax traillii TaxID=164674 RepID=UPI000FFD9AF1